MNPNLNRSDLINLETSVIAALAKVTPNESFPIEGKLVASKDLQTQVQAHLDTMNSVNGARAQFSELVDADKSQRVEMAPVLAGIRNHVAGLLGENSAAFASFGFKPRKAAERTAESKAEAVEKVRATRVARHTMGKRQKASIHGVVPPTPAAPVVTSPVSPAPSPTTPADASASGAATPAAVTNSVTH